MTTAVTFEVYAAGGTPDDTVPSFDGSGPTWTTGVLLHDLGANRWGWFSQFYRNWGRVA